MLRRGGGMLEAVTSSMVLVLHALLAAAAALHALVYKRDPRSALGWIGICIVFPLLGPLLYSLFGVNRVHTRARELTRRSPFRLEVGYERREDTPPAPVVEVSEVDPRWRPLARLSARLTRRPLVEGNTVEALHNGEAAYPAMLAAIEQARSRVWVATYIFRSDAMGRRFIDALAAAAARGVDVNVLIDGVGEYYAWPHAGRVLQRRGVRVERFMPPRLVPPSVHLNLRNHRKILLADSDQVFVGGMNIGDHHLASAGGRGRVADLHFRLRGPIVTQLETTFAEDWRFVTGEQLAPMAAASSPPPGDAICRAFSDGPNEDLDTLSLLLAGAVAMARAEVEIMTPYFVPPTALAAALQSAALRGVRVRVILPERSNLRFVDWATRNLLGELLQHGIEVRYQPPPFAHSKLFLLDGVYAIIGSANVDQRSLRLNFELAVEIFSAATVADLKAHCDRVAATARPVTLEEVDGRPLPVRVRDAVCWLFSPYL